MKKKIRQFIGEHATVAAHMTSQDSLESIGVAIRCLLDAYRRGNKILIAGNGGSAADSQHFVAELVSRFKRERPGLPAIALTTDSSILTAIGNDYSYDRVFAKQVEALASPGDVFIGISTSGSSSNILQACMAARRLGCKTIGLTGNRKGEMVSKVDILLEVESDNTARIQEMHILILHILAEFIEDGIFPIQHCKGKTRRAYDWDGVVSNGVVPDDGAPIISGRSWEEVRRIEYKGHPIYFNPKTYTEKNDQNSAEWKAEIINRIGIEEFFEDNPIQIEILEKLCPQCHIVDVNK